MAKARAQKPTIGWREWVAFPGLCGAPIKAKVDTGARTSALHAVHLSIAKNDDGDVAHFEIRPTQRSSRGASRVEVPVVDYRLVRSSNGRSERRPVIRAEVRLGDLSWPIDLTLTSRNEMGFRLLLGRAAVRRRFLVDPGRSFLLTPKEPG